MSNSSETCGIDVKLLTDNLADLNTNFDQIMASSNPYAGLLDSKFYNKVMNTTKQITQIKLDTMKCLTGNNRDALCSSIDNINANLRLDDLDNIVFILERYNDIIKKISKWLLVNLYDLQNYCGGDIKKIDRLKSILVKLGRLMSSPSIESARVSSEDCKNDEQLDGQPWKDYTYILLIILALIIVHYLMKKN